MYISLTKFCRDNGIPKTSAFTRCKELNIDTSNGLDESARQALLNEFNVQPISVEDPSSRQDPAIVVEVGNHRSAITYEVPTRYSLERFRSDRTRQALSNPTEFVKSLGDVVGGLKEAMDAAEIAQEEELQQIRRVKSSTVAKLNDLQMRAERYRMKSDLVALMQNNELDELTSAANEIQCLGKPQEED